MPFPMWINGENWQPSLCLFSAFYKICTVKLPKVSMSSLMNSTDDAQRGGGESVIAIRWLWSLHSSARPEMTPDNHQFYLNGVFAWFCAICIAIERRVALMPADQRWGQWWFGIRFILYLTQTLLMHLTSLMYVPTYQTTHCHKT